MTILADIETRPDYRSLPVSQWTYEECCEWLWDEGAWVCGDDGAFAACNLEEIREEVVLQSELCEGCDFDLVRDEFHERTWTKHNVDLYGVDCARDRK